MTEATRIGMRTNEKMQQITLPGAETGFELSVSYLSVVLGISVGP